MRFTSPLFSAVSGSIGGTTYSHNKGGMYARIRNTPPDKHSDEQLTWRGLFPAACALWATLTDSERQSWCDYAAKVPRVDRLGQSKHLSGHQHFFRSNIARVSYIDPAMICRAAPAIFDTGLPAVPLSVSGVYYSGADLFVTWLILNDIPATAYPIPTYIVSYVTCPATASHTYRRNSLRFVNFLDVSAGFPAGSSLYFTAYLGYSNTPSAAWLGTRVLYGDGRCSELCTIRFITQPEPVSKKIKPIA